MQPNATSRLLRCVKGAHCDPRCAASDTIACCFGTLLHNYALPRNITSKTVLPSTTPKETKWLCPSCCWAGDHRMILSATSAAHCSVCFCIFLSGAAFLLISFCASWTPVTRLRPRCSAGSVARSGTVEVDAGASCCFLCIWRAISGNLSPSRKCTTFL